MDIKQILEELNKRKTSRKSLSTPNKPGVYAFFVTKETHLGGFPTLSGQIIYIGLSTNLAQREFDTHFTSDQTGFSTIRRSFGAILKKELQLRPIPRGKGKSEQDYSCYRFQYDGEEHLTNWMEEHLQVGVFPYEGNLDDLETSLVAKAKPLLNLTKWQNPFRVKIKELRKNCADEAKKNNAV